MRHRRPDKKNAQSLLEAAKREMDFTLSIQPSEASASTIIRNIYECFRMLGDVLLLIKGIESEDHITPINELLSIKVETKRPILLIGSLRTLRHNINYNGYKPCIAELNDVLSIAKECFMPLYSEIKKKAD